jgi:hypothetical protein
MFLLPSTGDKPKIPQHSWPVLGELRAVVVRLSRVMKKPKFQFELTKECAKKNLSVLRKHSYNLEQALAAHQGTPLEYGSEFRTIEGWSRYSSTTLSGAI